jgi:mannosyltransferase
MADAGSTVDLAHPGGDNSVRRARDFRIELAFLCILLAAFGLRLYSLDAESLWIDEGYTISLARHSPFEIVEGAAADQHPPLYYLVLHLWLKGGVSVFYARFPSALLGLVSVALIGWLGRDLGGKKLGLIAAGILALSPYHIWYSQEARMYVLLCALGIVSAGLAWTLVQGEGRRRHWLLYLASSSLALYTHYFAFFLLLFENLVAVLWVWRVRTVRRWLTWLAGQAILVLVFAPWLPTAIYQARFHRMTWIPAPEWSALGNTLVYMCTGLADRMGASGYLAIGWAAIVLLAGAMAVWRERKHRCKATLFALLWWAVLILLVFAVSQRYPLFERKQFLIFLPGLLLFVARALLSFPRPATAVLVTVGLTMMVVALSVMYRAPQKQGWREAAEYVGQNGRPGDAVYLNPAAAGPTLAYYDTDSIPISGYPPEYDVISGGWKGEVVTPEIAAAELVPVAADHPRIWLMQSSASFWDPAGLFPAWLSEHGQLVAHQSFRGVSVSLYEVAND